ncbi:hypothetical protein D9758_004983 [Tetrapyrgos nigripes]|uniref:HAT C-terminal dimerisation domain-containing protein n=1 Tax=Tetrapyrgos nigripes TaxID=182062 RepID=A0A8H5GVZ0_9AGAR|nr:hypothetical protein D9758_004983 [Tetrapyrgos nigripes]
MELDHKQDAETSPNGPQSIRDAGKHLGKEFQAITLSMTEIFPYPSNNFATHNACRQLHRPPRRKQITTLPNLQTLTTWTGLISTLKTCCPVMEELLPAPKKCFYSALYPERQRAVLSPSSRETIGYRTATWLRDIIWLHFWPLVLLYTLLVCDFPVSADPQVDFFSWVGMDTRALGITSLYCYLVAIQLIIVATNETTIRDLKDWLSSGNKPKLPHWIWKTGAMLVYGSRFRLLEDTKSFGSLQLDSLLHIRVWGFTLGGADGSGDEGSEAATQGKRKRTTDKLDVALQFEHDEPTPKKSRGRKGGQARGGTRGRGRGREKGRGGKGTTSGGIIDQESVRSVIKHIFRLTSKLPDSIPLAESDSKIASSFSDDTETKWMAFNQLFDRAFGEDTRDDAGRLQYLTRGMHGMDLVNAYLAQVAENQLDHLPLELVHGKLIRLRDELRFLSFVDTSKSSAELQSDSDENDEDYFDNGRRRAGSEETVDSFMLGSDGEEIVVEQPHAGLSSKKLAGDSVDEEGSDVEIIEKGKGKDKGKGKEKEKAKVQAGQKGKHRQSDAPPKLGRLSRNDGDMVVSTESKSDGESALRGVQQASVGSRRGPKSDTRDYWYEPRLVRIKGELKWEFKSTEGCTSFDDEHPKPALSNLAAHLTKDHPDRGTETEKDDLRKISSEAASASLMHNYIEAGVLNPALEPTKEGFIDVFSAWVFEDSLPFTMGESSALRCVFAYLKVKFPLPTDTTVRKHLDKITSALHRTVVNEISNVTSKISYSHNTWTNRQMVFSFAGIMAHWIDDDWKLIERLVDFKHLEKDEHISQYAAKAFVKAASSRGGLDKMTITMDNASSCDTLATALGVLLEERYRIHFHPENNCIRCLAHIVNLVVQAVLRGLEEAEAIDDNDYFLLNKDAPIHYNEDDDEDLKAMEAEKFDEDGSADDEMDFELPEGASSLSALKRLRLITTKIVSSPQRRESFRECARKKYTNPLVDKNEKGTPLAKLMVIWDVRTRWNYTHAMLKRARLLRKAVNEWVHLHEEFHELTLSLNDWKWLENLENFLEKFTQVTLTLSHSHTPTLPFVLPMYRHMANELHLCSNDSSFPATMCGAMHEGIKKLDKYHKLAKENHFYVLATACHPAFRLRWFGPAHSDEYVRAHAIFETAYQTYASMVPSGPSGTSLQKPSRDLPANKSFLLGLTKTTSLVSIEPGHEKTPPPAAPQQSEFDRYISNEGGEGDIEKPLDWWRNHCAPTGKDGVPGFPVIARIARDFLAIPGASVSVERLFSKSRHMCTDLRSSMKAETTTKAMCSKCWLRDGLFEFESRKLVSSKIRGGKIVD